MTFEKFTLAVRYPNREQQFYKYYNSHLALFKLMSQYMDEKSGIDISIRDTGKRCKYILSLQPNTPGDLLGLEERIHSELVSSNMMTQSLMTNTIIRDDRTLEIFFN